MSDLSAVQSPPAPPRARKAEPPERPASRGRQDALSMAAAGSSFSVQGAIGFLAGGLVSLICIGASALAAVENYETAARAAGYGLGGALGGAALVWGSGRKHACRSAACGFALGFLVPAWLAAPALNRLLTLKLEAYGIGTFLATAIAFTVGFGAAGAIGGAFVMPRLFWAGMVRFGLAAALGSAVAATAPAFNLHGDSAASQNLAGLVAALSLGHLIPFAAGGYWFGRAVEAEERHLRQPRRIPR